MKKKKKEEVKFRVWLYNFVLSFSKNKKVINDVSFQLVKYIICNGVLNIGILSKHYKIHGPFYENIYKPIYMWSKKPKVVINN